MNFTAARHEGEKKNERSLKKGRHLSGIKRKPSVITRRDYTWLVMSSKCAQNLRQGNIKCEWCWRLTKAVGRWGRLVLLMPLFEATLSFGYSVMWPTFTKQASGIALIHPLPSRDCVYCHYLKWLPFSEAMSEWAHWGNMQCDTNQPENRTLCSVSFCLRPLWLGPAAAKVSCLLLLAFNKASWWSHNHLHRWKSPGRSEQVSQWHLNQPE